MGEDVNLPEYMAACQRATSEFRLTVEAAASKLEKSLEVARSQFFEEQPKASEVVPHERLYKQ